MFVLGPEDGHSKLVDITRQLSAEVAMQRLSLDSLTISYVDSVIQGKWSVDLSQCIIARHYFTLCDVFLFIMQRNLTVTKIVSNGDDPFMDICTELDMRWH